jgi:glycosyltransferase involved in cell wall biosynthesis
MMPSPRRIAFVSPRFPEGATVGGAETLLRRLAEQTALSGIAVDFLTTCARDHFTWANVVPPGIRKEGPLTVHYFPVDTARDLDAFVSVQNRISHGAEVSRDDELVWLRNNVNSTPLYEHLRTEGHAYDRIVMGPYLFGLIYFASLIHPSKTLLLPCLHDESFAYLATIGDMFRSVAGWIFNSDPERDLAVKLYGINPSSAHVVGMGLTPFTPDPSAFRQRHHLDTPFLIYSGRREPLKGTPLLLDYVDVFRQRTGQDLRLVLTGAGPVELPATLTSAVMDLGFVSESEKHDAMAASLAFVHPSVNESFSIVIMESWLAGTPVLVHGGGDVMPFHCRQSGGGLWFRNYPEFEEEAMLLVTNPELRNRLGSAGRQYVLDRYNWASVGKRLANALAI